ncbi:MAG TPA: AarF/UbiB family protein [Polyangiaceae bacterium]|nr:AarF/UbiB family protein [Polyangiaceae bacterium]
MLRSLYALLLFATLFGSYGLGWLLGKVNGGQRHLARMERIHASNARRLARGFTRLRGVFIKLGQLLSVVGTFLPRAYGEAMQALQDRVPARPFDEIESRLYEAFGDNPRRHFKQFDQRPLAAASLAQVHRAVLADGRVVAVKMRYPGIEALIRHDLALLRLLLPLVQKLVQVQYLGRVLDQIEAMLTREIDYAHERSNMERIRSIFAGRKDVVVPEVVDEFTGAGVLTMSYEEGVKLTDSAALAEHGIDPEAVAELLVECYVAMLFDHRVFHADPHPGNFLVRAGPTLVILDYGAVEEVTDALAEGMKTIVLGALTRDSEQILIGIERMGFVAEGGDRKLLGEVGREYLKVLKGVQIEDFSRIDRRAVEKLSGYQQARGKLREIMRSVQYPEGYFYVERTLVLLFGLVGQLAPKKGLPGLVLPYASKVFLQSFAPGTAASGDPAPPDTRAARSSG